MIAGLRLATSKCAVQFENTCAFLLDGYGSFFALDNPLSKALLMFVTFLFPFAGLMGMLGGVFVIIAKRLLTLSKDNERIEIVNGILLGLLVGSTYAFNIASVALVAFGSILVVVASNVLTDTLTRYLRLPLLGLPYLIAAYIILPIGINLWLPPSTGFQLLKTAAPYIPFAKFLMPVGAIYFNGTAVGGLLTVIAFACSSRYLAILAIAQVALCTLLIEHTLPGLGGSILNLVAQMNAVLTACVIGGLYTVPGKRSILVALSSGTISCLLAVSLQHLLTVIGLPVLALPFVLTTYAVFITLSPQHGGPWSIFWLTIPELAEKSLERIKLAQARGVDMRSVSLKPPFAGTWQVYQGFNGKHTHQGIWRYALDFFQIESGVSYKGEGTKLNQYHCYAKPVVSPAYGTVIDCKSNCKDNMPGQVDTVNNFGNYITIFIGYGKYLVLAHLQKDSIKVKLGDYVTPGQVLALVGNSGRSPQPHLHMQVQDGPSLGSRTIPFHLSDVIVNGNSEGFCYSLNYTPSELESITVPLRNAALKKALNLSVGNGLEFDFQQNSGTISRIKLESKLDVLGQFYLSSETGAQIAYTATDDLVAFFDRKGPDDPLIDAFALSLGLTPLTEGTATWKDLTPVRLLPLPIIIKMCLYLVAPLAHSYYQRSWDQHLKRWVQYGKHELDLFSLFKWTCKTEAHLSESLGVLYLEVSTNGELRTAILAGQSIREDNGIPERSSSICQPNA